MLPAPASCRLCLQLLEDEGSADEDFWNQEFFEEEAEDVEYNSSNASESEAPDVPDSDFDESVRCSAACYFSVDYGFVLSPLLPVTARTGDRRRKRTLEEMRKRTRSVHGVSLKAVLAL